MKTTHYVRDVINCITIVYVAPTVLHSHSIYSSKLVLSLFIIAECTDNSTSNYKPIYMTVIQHNEQNVFNIKVK